MPAAPILPKSDKSFSCPDVPELHLPADCIAVLFPVENPVRGTVLLFVQSVSGAVAAVLMYLFQSVFNFFVVSGTGQAAITMPIMAPLSDLLGVSRQTAVVAFQLGDAFTNLIVPTSGCLIGSLAIAKIEWSNWIKFMWKFLGVLMIGAIITILIAVGTGF